jgi:hypothetical protein
MLDAIRMSAIDCQNVCSSTYSWNRLGTAEVLGPHAPSAFSCILGSAKEAMMEMEMELKQDNSKRRLFMNP